MSRKLVAQEPIKATEKKTLEPQESVKATEEKTLEKEETVETNTTLEPATVTTAEATEVVETIDNAEETLEVTTPLETTTENKYADHRCWRCGARQIVNAVCQNCGEHYDQ